MFPVAADIRALVRVAATAAATLLVLATTGYPSRAQTSHMLVVPASDGYGFDDCLAGNKPCGQTIADAWCEAHGMNSAASFGRSDDITASVKPAVGVTEKVDQLQPGSFIVNCRN